MIDILLLLALTPTLATMKATNSPPSSSCTISDRSLPSTSLLLLLRSSTTPNVSRNMQLLLPLPNIFGDYLSIHREIKTNARVATRRSSARTRTHIPTNTYTFILRSRGAIRCVKIMAILIRASFSRGGDISKNKVHNSIRGWDVPMRMYSFGAASKLSCISLMNFDYDLDLLNWFGSRFILIDM